MRRTLRVETAMRTETVEYEADGLHMVSQLMFDNDASGRRPGVLVFPDIFGVSDHAKERAERLVSECGYVALACDIHGDAQVYSDLEEVMAVMGPVRTDPARIRARARGGLEALLARPEVAPADIGAIGYCFGGTVALELARSGADIKAAVGFHSGLATKASQDAKAIKGKVLVCIGADDPGVPPDQRMAFEQEMREGGVDWRMSLYGGVVHSFTDRRADSRGMPEFARYDAQADRRSWREMRNLFDDVFAAA